MISMSWRAAWKTLVTASLAISRKNGFRSMSGDSGSISAVTPGAAIWIEAEFRPERRFADELGVDGDEFGLFESGWTACSSSLVDVISA